MSENLTEEIIVNSDDEEDMDTTNGTIQDHEGRRELRHRYRQLISETQQEDEHDTKQLKDKLNEVRQLFEKVHMPREATLDSKLLRQLASVGMRKAEMLHTNVVSFDPHDFIERTARFISSTEIYDSNGINDINFEDWATFGKSVTPLYKRSPAFSFMLGSFTRTTPDVPVKSPPVRKIKDLSDNAKSTAPQKIVEMGKSDQEVTTEEVERVLNILRAFYERNTRNPICFFEFVCHPTSFTQTVQNIFHTSFLIKDGYAHMYLDSEGLPVIEPTNEEENQSQARESNELVLSITWEEWKNIVETFQIKNPLIPARVAAVKSG